MKSELPDTEADLNLFLETEEGPEVMIGDPFGQNQVWQWTVFENEKPNNIPIFTVSGWNYGVKYL